MEKKRLELDFKNEDGSNVKVAVDNPKSDLTEEIVKTAMKSIIEKDIFQTTGGSLKLVAGASIVTTTEAEFF